MFYILTEINEHIYFYSTLFLYTRIPELISGYLVFSLVDTDLF